MGHHTSTGYNAAGRNVASINPLGYRTSTAYDAAGRSVANINSLGQRTSTVYDAADRTIATINALGYRSSTAYDAAGRSIASIDALNNRTTTLYDAASQTIASINPLGKRTSTLYDDAGRSIAGIDPLNNRTSTVYDAASRSIASINPLGRRTSTLYDAAGQSLAAIDPLGNRSSTVYDAAGRSIASSNPLGQRTSTAYDAAGRSIASINALNQRSSTVYDAASQAVAAINPLGYRSSTLYDAAGRSVASVDALSRRTSTVYDAVGQTLATVNPLGYRTSQLFDATGQRTVLIDGNANRVTFLFDGVGQDVGSINPIGRRMTMAYDAAGRQTMKLDPRGNRASYTYDAAGQTTLERYADGTRVSFLYDDANNRTRMHDSVGITTTIYDAARQVTVHYPSIGGRVTYAFDEASRRSLMIDPEGGRFTYGYDAANRMTKVVNPQNKRTTLGYDSAGRQTLQVHSNGSRTTQAYDAAGRLTVQIQADGIGTSRRTTNSYDATGKRTLMHESSGARTSWTYDPAGQLRREQRNGTGSFDVTHLYDPAGNRTLMIDSGVRTTATYDAANELLVERTNSARTTYQYDANGNTTRKDTGSALTIYDWDVRNRMTAAKPVGTPVTSTYDGTGKRVKKQVGGATKQFLYDFENLLRETDGTGALQREYTTTTEQYGDLLNAYDGSSTSYYEFDPQYSTEALLDDSGSVTDRYKYRSFGQASHTTGSSTQPQTFVGRQRVYYDPEVELYCYGGGTRYTDVGAPRFKSEDLIGYSLQQPNLYVLDKNDPVNYTDPSGLEHFVVYDDGKLRDELDKNNIEYEVWDYPAWVVTRNQQRLPGGEGYDKLKVVLIYPKDIERAKRLGSLRNYSGLFYFNKHTISNDFNEKGEFQLVRLGIENPPPQPRYFLGLVPELGNNGRYYPEVNLLLRYNHQIGFDLWTLERVKHAFEQGDQTPHPKAAAEIQQSIRDLIRQGKVSRAFRRYNVGAEAFPLRPGGRSRLADFLRRFVIQEFGRIKIREKILDIDINIDIRPGRIATPLIDELPDEVLELLYEVAFGLAKGDFTSVISWLLKHIGQAVIARLPGDWQAIVRELFEAGVNGRNPNLRVIVSTLLRLIGDEEGQNIADFLDACAGDATSIGDVLKQKLRLKDIPGLDEAINDLANGRSDLSTIIRLLPQGRLRQVLELIEALNRGENWDGNDIRRKLKLITDALRPFVPMRLRKLFDDLVELIDELARLFDIARNIKRGIDDLKQGRPKEAIQKFEQAAKDANAPAPVQQGLAAAGAVVIPILELLRRFFGADDEDDCPAIGNRESLDRVRQQVDNVFALMRAREQLITTYAVAEVCLPDGTIETWIAPAGRLTNSVPRILVPQGAVVIGPDCSNLTREECHAERKILRVARVQSLWCAYNPGLLSLGERESA